MSVIELEYPAVTGVGGEPAQHRRREIVDVEQREAPGAAAGNGARPRAMPRKSGRSSRSPGP
jgi:hypothetical protein